MGLYSIYSPWCQLSRTYKSLYLWCLYIVSPKALNSPYDNVIQGISYWSVKSKSALRGRRIHNLIELWCLVGSGGLDIWVSSTSFQKSNIGWPQQPLTERVLKFNMIFPYSTPIFFSSKHQSKAEFKNLNDNELLSSDFPGLITSAT